jgi:ribosome-associated toxin RatA of RatAB toxin-antitoxin module
VRSVVLRFEILKHSPDHVYATLSDFERYPELCDAVQSVRIRKAAAGVTVSAWEVSFRAGKLQWVEEDTFDRVKRTITFRQLDGDMALFDGTWNCDPTHDGTEITFRARLDMGIPSLADALEPIAVRALIENTRSIMVGLFGEAAMRNCHADDAAPVGAAA